ncbi:tyrosine-type recombinase/integrase [Candidatus Bipolaricaulota bacterium]|nr:tyrosine-type recombinase/integrase [Candidatus Bipolaricaulota bacterium]
MERVDKFTEEEYEKIKSYVRENEIPRNYLMVVLGYNLPRRISHLLELKVKDVRKDNGEVKSGIFKEGWADTIPIDDRSNKALQWYFNKVDARQSDWLFTSTTHDQNINRSWVWKLVKRWANEVGLEGHYGTDSLRKHEVIHGGTGTSDYYSIDINTFDDLESERSAYALGLFATDGTIHVEDNELEFRVTDRELAENFRSCLKSDKDLHIDYRTGQRPLYRYSTCQIDIIKGIEQYVPRRSKDWNEVSSMIKDSPTVNHFVRGVIDGDGHVGRGKENGHYNVIITGKYGVLNDLKDIIVEGCGVERIDVRKKFVSDKAFGGKETYDLYIVGRDQVQLLYDWIYDDAQYYLTRKKKAMENIVVGDTNTSEYMDKLWSE